MDNRISLQIEAKYGQILLLSLTSQPTLDEILQLVPDSEIAICDFYALGCENWPKRSWGYENGRVQVIDHHAPDMRWQRQISSGNLALNFVKERGPCSLAIINHTDCDSILSAGIATGLLSPSDAFGKAVIAADHTGEENALADLLQALQPLRDVAFSFECLHLLLRGEPLPRKAQDLLNDRTNQRITANRLVERGYELRGRLACFHSEIELEGAMVAAQVANAWAVGISFPINGSTSHREVKLRLTESAPIGLSLHRLGLNAVDPAFKGRWNAGSNKRSGGTSQPLNKYFEGIAKCLHRFENSWMLGRAVQVATAAHDGQFDKAGAPYVLHPLRVMDRCKNPTAKIAAVLHDVIEDCDGWTLERLREEGFSEEVIRVVDLVTHKAEDNTGTIEGYMAFITRCAADPIAREVKLADIEDNMDLSRIPYPTDRDWARLEKYETARLVLLGTGLTPALIKQLKETGTGQFRFQNPQISERNTSFEVRFRNGVFVDARTGNQIIASDGAFAKLTIPLSNVIGMPGSLVYGLEEPVVFLDIGTSIYAAVKIHHLTDDLRAMLFNLGDTPTRLAKWNPKDPLNPIFTKPTTDLQFVEILLEEDLRLLFRGTRLAKLCECKVRVPSLEAEFASVNQAYMAIAAVFEPWRRSVATNAFRTAYAMSEHTNAKGETVRQFETLDFRRTRIQQVLLALCEKQSSQSISFQCKRTKA